jgi:aminomethyltransferase
MTRSGDATGAPADEPVQQFRRSPIHAQHESSGAKFALFAGWEMPLEYAGGGVLAEHAAVRDAVGLFDVSHLGTLDVQGPGALEFLNTQLTNDLNRLEAGSAQYTLMCTEDGGVIDDLIAYVTSDADVRLVPNAANCAMVRDRLQRAAPRGVEVLDRHADTAILAVQGPASAQVLLELGLDPDLAYMRFNQQAFGDTTVSVCRSGYTGEPGFELIAATDAAAGLWEALTQAAAHQGGRPAGLGARDTLRTEMGYPLHGQDLSLKITPVQAGLSWAVGWDKEQFVGRSALVAERAAGPRQRLRGIRLTDAGVPRPGMKLLAADGEGEIGVLTSGTFSPTLRIGIGLALCDAGVGLGDEALVEARGRHLAAEVVKPPFVETSPR